MKNIDSPLGALDGFANNSVDLIEIIAIPRVHEKYFSFASGTV